MNGTPMISRREKRVLDLLMKGLTNEGISRELGTSVNTVKYHLKRIYSKLGVRNRVEAIMKISHII